MALISCFNIFSCVLIFLRGVIFSYSVDNIKPRLSTFDLNVDGFSPTLLLYLYLSFSFFFSHFYFDFKHLSSWYFCRFNCFDPITKSFYVMKFLVDISPTIHHVYIFLFFHSLYKSNQSVVPWLLIFFSTLCTVFFYTIAITVFNLTIWDLGRRVLYL